jgi:two-component system cell cycle response regulator DivK
MSMANTRILVIEDDAPSLELALILLEHAGYDTQSARDGAAGLALARSWHPDIVLCDIEMPVLTGYDLAQALRADASWSAVPLVAISAFSMRGDRLRAIKAGFDGYLPKPIVPECFVQEVEAFLPPGKRCGHAH